MRKGLKFLILLVLTVSVFDYALLRTSHELIIPQDIDGEVVVKVTDAELEDQINDLLKIPLKFFPREICLTNNNHVYSDDVEVMQSEEFPNVGEMNLYVEKNGEQVIESIHASVGERICRPVNPATLEGATTTANYTQAAFIKFEKNTDGSLKVIGGHEISGGFQTNVTVDTSKTLLQVSLSIIGRLLLLGFCFLGVSAVVLASFGLVREVRRFIWDD